MARPKYKLNEEQKNKAIEVYQEKGNLNVAAQAIGISRASLYKATKVDKHFAADMELAKATYCDVLREIIHSVVQGEIEVDQRRSNMIMFSAKAHMPEYRDKEITHKHEGTIKVVTGVPRPKKDKSDG